MAEGKRRWGRQAKAAGRGARLRNWSLGGGCEEIDATSPGRGYVLCFLGLVPESPCNFTLIHARCPICGVLCETPTELARGPQSFMI
jgi:hypothetical protein